MLPSPRRLTAVLLATLAAAPALADPIAPLAPPPRFDSLAVPLPPLDLADRDAVMRLAAEGPAEEMVGLDGYGVGDDSTPSEPGGLAGQGFGGEGMPYPPVSSPCSEHQSARPSGPVDIEIMRGPAR